MRKGDATKQAKPSMSQHPVGAAFSRGKGPTQMCVEIHWDPTYQLDHPPRGAHGVFVHGRLINSRLGVKEHVRCSHIGSSEHPPRIGRDGVGKIVKVREAGSESLQSPLQFFQTVLRKGVLRVWIDRLRQSGERSGKIKESTYNMGIIAW